MMGVLVGPEVISVSHRIPTSQKYQGKRSLPAVIVKFARRDTNLMKCFAGGGISKERPNLVAVIFGGAVVLRGLEDNLTMNGSLSYDPETNDNQGINFTWQYGKIERQYNASVISLRKLVDSFTTLKNFTSHELRNATGPIINIDKSLFHYKETIIVKLTVAKDHRASSVSQIVHLLKGDPPKVFQR